VPDELLGAANSLFASVRQLLRLCGPLLGAGLFAAYGGRAVALVDIASFVVAAGALAILTLAETRPVRTRLHWLHEVAAGVRHIHHVPALRRTTTAFGICMLALGAVDTMVFAYVDDGLHRPPTFLGVLVSVQGIGVLIGALLAGRIMARLGEIAVSAIGIVTFGIAIAIAVDPVVYLAFIAMPFAGIGNAVIGVAFNTLLQRRTPEALMGRASAAADMVIGGAATLSMALGATLVAFVDYREVFAVISVVVLVTGGLLWRVRQSDPTVPAPIDPARELVGDRA
jgi:predicted MFS family arabinose efflux permease